MLRLFTYLSLSAFVITQYAHNLVDESIRVDFYFISLSVLLLFMSIRIKLSKSNTITNALLALAMANVVNQIFFAGDLTYLEVLLTLLFLTIISIRDGI